jgi:hypothetical protein
MNGPRPEKKPITLPGGRREGEHATTKWEKRKKRNRRREQIASRSRRINRIRG